MADARITVPAQVSRGQPFEVRILIRHPMETGYRTDEAGRPIACSAIRTLTCRYGGETVFAAQLSPGIAANPYLRFFVTARESGALAFDGVDDSGARGGEQVVVTVV